MSTEVKVGIIFLVGLFICGAFTVIIGGLEWLVGGGHTINVIFESVHGLKEGHLVRVLGLVVGKVKELELNEGYILATLSLDEEVTFYEDYEIWVREESMVGGRHISIYPGTPGKKVVDTSKPLAGKSPPAALDAVSEVLEENRDRINNVISALEEVAQQIKEGKGNLGKFVKDETLYNDAGAFLREGRAVIEDLRETSDKLAKGEGSAGRFFHDEELYNNLKDASQKVKALFEEIERGEGTLGQLLKDKTLYEDVKKSAEDIRQFTENLNSDKGLLGALSTDEELKNDVKATVSDIKESAASMKSILREAEEGKGTLGKLIKEETLYEKATGAMESVDEVAGKVARTKTYLGLQTKGYFDSGLSVHKVWLRIVPSEHKYFMAAANFMSLDRDGDITFEEQVEENDDTVEIKPDVILAYKFFDDHITFRAGMLEGKFGGGFDADFQCPVFDYPMRFSLEARDAYSDLEDEDIDENIDGALVRSEISIPLFNYFRLHVGASNILDDPELLVGLTFEFEEEDVGTLVGLLGLTR